MISKGIIKSENEKSNNDGDILSFLLNDSEYTSLLTSIEFIISNLKQYNNKTNNSLNNVFAQTQEREIFSKINLNEGINIEEEKYSSILKNLIEKFDSNGVTLLHLDLEDYQRRRVAFINVNILLILYLYTHRISLIIC